MAETAQADLNVSFHADFEQAKRELKTMAGELKKVTSDVDLFEKFVGKLDSALSMAAGGTNTADTTFQRLDSSVNKLTKSIDVLNNKFANFAKNSKQAFASTAETKKNLEDTAKGVRDMAAQANRFNTGNIAAQLQDIGVTAAMNMNPLTIGLQQGTQLVYVLQQSKAPLAEFVAGIKSLFTPLSLVVVGLTALVAAGIQFVNWVDVGKGLLNGLASGFDYIAENVEVFVTAIGAAGVTLIAFNAKAIGTTIVNLTKLGASAVATGVKMAAAWIVGMGPVGWVIAGITALTVAFLTFGDKIKELFTGKFGQYVKVAVNGLIGSFVAAIDSVVQSVVWAWQKIQSLWGGEGPKMGFMDTINQTIDKDINRDYLKMAGEGLSALDNATGNVVSGTVSKAIEGVKTGATAVADKFREWSKGIGESTKNTKDLQKEIDKIAKSYDNIFTKQSDKYENMQFEESIKGLSTYEKTYLTVSRDMAKDVENLKQQAIAAGVPISKINEMFADSEDKIRVAAEAQADLTARIEESTMVEEEFNEFVRTAQSETSTFFKDMRHGLRDGQSAWEAFGNAVNNVLDKILDKLIDIGVEAAFSGLGSNTGGKGNSFLGTLFTAGKNLFGGISAGTQVYNSPIGPTMPGATPLTGAANGGVFSNGVYSSPTLFKFAKGGKFGVMGEAGPEAVMPLRRGPDGSLGVKADGVGGGSPVVVNVINNSNAQARTEQRQTSQGIEIDVMIDEMVAEKLGRNGTASNNALRAYNNRQLVMR